MKVKIKVPTSLKDIKLSQYQKFLKTVKDSKDTKFINRQLVGIFCNLSDDIVGNIAKRDFDSIVSDLTIMLDFENNSKFELQQVINYNGVEYGFMPKIDDITVDEQADIDSMIGDWSKMQKVMAVMYRPIVSSRKGKYLIKPYMEDVSNIKAKIDKALQNNKSSLVDKLRLDLIDAQGQWEKDSNLDLTMDVVQGAILFFCNLMSDLLSCTQSYIKEEVIDKNTQILEENGVGIKTFTNSLEQTFLNLKMLVSYDYTKHYSS